MTSLKQHIADQHRARRSTRPRRTGRPIGEDVGDVRVTRSSGLDAATVALPAGISLDDRAARMNDFWKALAEFQYRNVMVVAICAGEES